MAIAVDAATVARWAGSTAQNTDFTSGAFTPTANSMLLVCLNSDVTNGTVNLVGSVSGGSLTWTPQIARNGTTGGGSAYAGIFTAPVGGSPSSMTVAARHSSPAGTFQKSAKLYIVTGQDAATPIGTSTGGASTANPSNAATYNSTGANSRGFACVTDWSGAGAATSSDATIDAANYAGLISVGSLFKAADTATPGTAVPFNYDAPGAGAVDLTWVVLEILPSTGAVSDPTRREYVQSGAVGRAATWCKKHRGILVPDLWLPAGA